MKYLLIKEKKTNKFVLYSPDTFGMETWGMTTQKSLEKKKKYWYIHHWSAGNEWVEDENYDERINVVLEATDIKPVVQYVIKDTHGNRAAVEAILIQANNIYNDYVAFSKWVNSNKNK